MTGDDFTHYYPPVQQALNEWVASKPNATFEPPALWAARWKGAQRNRLVRILEPCTPYWPSNTHGHGHGVITRA